MISAGTPSKVVTLEQNGSNLVIVKVNGARICDIHEDGRLIAAAGVDTAIMQVENNHTKVVFE